MSSKYLAAMLVGAGLLMAADTAWAHTSTRRVTTAYQPAPACASEAGCGLQVPHDGTSAGAAYIQHCCPPPRGYCPIRCDPNAYNCYRAMNQGLRLRRGPRW